MSIDYPTRRTTDTSMPALSTFLKQHSLLLAVLTSKEAEESTAPPRRVVFALEDLRFGRNLLYQRRRGWAIIVAFEIDSSMGLVVDCKSDEALDPRVACGVANLSGPTSGTEFCLLGNVDRNRLYQANLSIKVGIGKQAILTQTAVSCIRSSERARSKPGLLN